MSIKKKMGIYIGIFLAVFIILSYVSRESNNYISIITNRESKDIFNKNKEEIFLYKKNGEELKEVPIFRYLNNYMSVNSKNGEYLIRVKENKHLEESMQIVKGEGKVLEVLLNYIPKSDSRKNNIFLNLLTGTFLLFNLRILYNFKKEIIRKERIIFPIIFICLKILLTNSLLFSDVILIRINLLVTSILGIYLLLYVKNKSYQIKNDKLINIFLSILFIMYYTGEVIVTSAILNPNILNYLIINYPEFLNLSVFLYIWIDALIIIFIIFLLESIKIKKKQIIKEIEKKNLAMIGSFIILSLVVEFFVNNNKYFYYLNMFEFVYIFWYIFLIDINTMGKIKVINLKIFQMFFHIYIFFIITEDIWIPLGVLVSFFSLNLWTYFITGTLRVKKSYIDNLINRMYLTKNSEEFKEQLSRELKKNLELRDVKVKIFIQRDDYKKILLDRIYDNDEIILEKNDIIDKKYDYAVRLKTNRNPFVGLILLQNNEIKLVYEEKRYLEEVVEKLSLVATRYRFEKLQEELN